VAVALPSLAGWPCPASGLPVQRPSGWLGHHDGPAIMASDSDFKLEAMPGLAWPLTMPGGPVLAKAQLPVPVVLYCTSTACQCTSVNS
jgi:hypothetical protein